MNAPSDARIRPAELFHPATAAWLADSFPAPTRAQQAAWPAIAAQRHTLIAAPTGSGKTLAAFLSAIDQLVRRGLEAPLPDQVQVLYVSPLRALSQDIHVNLERPLAGIGAVLDGMGAVPVPIRTAVRTGDTPARERERMRRLPPHILVTTPESLYILLTSASGRQMLRGVRQVIVDEIHALAGSKRGAHLMLSLERLQALAPQPLVRIGLSATQKPIARVARYLVGAAGDCHVVDIGHERARDLALEIPDSPLDAVMANEVWSEIYDRLAALVREHRSTLVFVNTRRLAERVARFLGERLGEEAVAAHHGSLAREHRLAAEQRLKAGKLPVLVCTASLELGIDIGDVDLVCQLGSPRSISAFLQRVGRSGHSVGGLPKGRLFPLSRADLLECVALLDAAARGELDEIELPQAPLDVLAQQIVAEVASQEWGEDDLYACVCRAWPWRDLPRSRFEQVVRMLAEGYSTRRGRRGAWLHRDAVNGRLRGRRGAALAAVTNAGVIPDQFDYQVLLAPENLRIGSVNEDFAFESLPGDIFQLGNTAYRILKVETGRVHVADAHGERPTIPFWFGEAPGRSDALSAAVSRLSAAADETLETQAAQALAERLAAIEGVPSAAAGQLADYLASARAALGSLPTLDRVIFERFFDETGNQHLVVHSCHGSRINKAWGLALRKRFCKRFNFELQAAALDDSILISLGVVHSFPLAEVARWLHPATATGVLEQAVIGAPMFEARWRWCVTAALAVLRQRGGKRAPPQFQRNDAEDLLALVFPDQLACQDNVVGEREIPDHPLVRQTLDDCLHEAMDLPGLLGLLRRIGQEQVQVLARDLTAPSVLAEAVVNARPFAFLDDAPQEERRALAIRSRSGLDVEDARDLGRLDPQAIAQVRDQAWPAPRDADELHDGLMLAGFFTGAEIEAGGPVWQSALAQLQASGRAQGLALAGGMLWSATERCPELLALCPRAADVAGDGSLPPVEQALRELLRSRLEVLGPVPAHALGAPLEASPAAVLTALLELEQEGFAVRGAFETDAAVAGKDDELWCERRLLARIHRDTLGQLREQVRPVSEARYRLFQRRWQGLEEPGEGRGALVAAIEQLAGWSQPAALWESEILPARVRDYSPHSLDQLGVEGAVAWVRLVPPKLSEERPRARTPVRATPIALVPRDQLWAWRRFAARPAVAPQLSSTAERVREALERHGACFFGDLADAAGLLRTQLESALAELVALGLVTSDSFAGLRSLLAPASQRPGFSARGGRRRRSKVPGLAVAGRWSLLPELPEPSREQRDEALAQIIDTLLLRHGVVFRAALDTESGLPPWRDLLYLLRRLEARGEIRGGRFVERFAGEQFALPDAVGLLRRAPEPAAVQSGLAGLSSGIGQTSSLH